MLLLIGGIECEWSNRYTRRNRENRLKQYIERKETCTIVETTAARDRTIVPSSFNTSLNPFLLINLLSSHFPLIRFYLFFSLPLPKSGRRRSYQGPSSLRKKRSEHANRDNNSWKNWEARFTHTKAYYQDAKGQTQFHFCILVSRDCVAPRARAFSSFLSRTQQRARAHTHAHTQYAHTFSFFSPFVLKSTTRESSKSQSRPILVTLRFFRVISLLPPLRRSNYCKLKLPKNRPTITTTTVGGGSRETSLFFFFPDSLYHVSTTCNWELPRVSSSVD